VANRAIIVRRLLDLENTRWKLDLDPGGRDLALA
jgi:hypothetical protein